MVQHVTQHSMTFLSIRKQLSLLWVHTHVGVNHITTAGTYQFRAADIRKYSTHFWIVYIVLKVRGWDTF